MYLILIKAQVFSSFSQKAVKHVVVKPTLVCTYFEKISSKTNNLLEGQFTIEEIKEVACCCGNNKALEPNVFTFKFLKQL